MVLPVIGATGGMLLLPDSVPIRRLAGPVHERLALGSGGAAVVLVVTGVAVLLEFSGAVLWWRRKQLAIRVRRGWWRTIDDAHHSLGIVLLPLMLLLALTGLGLDVVGPDQPELRRTIMSLHTAGPFPTVVKLLYLGASLAFVVQGLTGVLMWWKPSWLTNPARRARAAASEG